MGSKEVYSHYLLEVKRDYTKQLCNLLVPVMYEGILSLYTSAKNARKDVPMKMFQLVLSKVPEWNQHTITTEYNRIITKTNCEWINELITAVFISHAKILSSIKTKKKTKTLNLKIPNGDYFIHKAYIECARQFWKNPYLLYDEVNSIEYQRNLRDSEGIIEQCIEETIRKLLPIRNILQQYIAVDEDSSSSSSSDEETADISNSKQKENKHDTVENKNERNNDSYNDNYNDNDNYNEEYVTQTITEKGKRRLKESVKKTLKTSVKTENDDQFSNYSVSQEIPIKKKRPINNNSNNNSGIVNIVSSTQNKNHSEGGYVNNIDSVNEINITNLEGDLYNKLDPSNSIEISLSDKKKKIKNNLEKSVDLENSSFHLDNLSVNGGFVLDFNDNQTKLELNRENNETDKKSSHKIVEKQNSLYDDIVLNFDNENQGDKRSDKGLGSHHSFHDDIVLNFENENQGDKRSDKKSEKGLPIHLSSHHSLHDDIVLNFENENQGDKRSEKISNFVDNLENIQNAGVLSEKKNKSTHSNDIQLNLTNKSDINIPNPTSKTVKPNLDIELVDYIKKENYDTESVFNMSMDFDITDPKTFISSNGSDAHKLPVSLVIDEKDIQKTGENIKSDIKNIIITNLPSAGVEEQPRKTSLKRRNEKKSYSFF
jgi:hypothetical protein